MNKQQLAAKIWESANRMRGKVDASEYKDFILGFIFYKYLSEKEEQFFLGEGMTAGAIGGRGRGDGGLRSEPFGLLYLLPESVLYLGQSGQRLYCVASVRGALGFQPTCEPPLQKGVRRHLHHFADGVEQVRRQHWLPDEGRARSHSPYPNHPHEHAPGL